MSKLPTNEPQRTPFWDETLHSLRHYWPPASWLDVGVVVGCSGGADSVALLRAVGELRKRSAQARGFLIAAHFNHALRGNESDHDAAFVGELAGQLQVRFESARGDGQITDEANLRTERLQFLIDTAKTAGARYIAVAHTVDDNVETVLHHLMRGTGPAGIAGISPTRPLEQDLVLVRPLLSMRRSTLRAGLREIGQAWREDSSNRNTDYRRNWIRRQLIPQIQSQFPQAVEAIGRAIESQQQWRTTIDRQARRWLDSHLISHSPVTIQRDSQTDQAIIIAALQRLWDQQFWPRKNMAQFHWHELANLIQLDRGHSLTLPAAVRARTEGDRVTIDRQSSSARDLP